MVKNLEKVSLSMCGMFSDHSQDLNFSAIDVSDNDESYHGQDYMRGVMVLEGQQSDHGQDGNGPSG